jgi:tetratricopeptide (TPR) repeat protein
VVQYRPDLGDSLRPFFNTALIEFRTRIPSDLWPIADAVEMMFEGRVAMDTSKIIEGWRLMIETQSQTAGYRSRFNVARLLVFTGQYEEGVAVLDVAATDSVGPTDGYLNIMSHYIRGLAAEGLGDPSGAIKHYQDVLKYWDKADLQLAEIVDVRKRLARLTS